MELNIEAHTHLDGTIVITDTTNEYGLYLSETSEVVQSFDSFKYSETVTFDALVKHTTEDVELLDVKMLPHDVPNEEIIFKTKDDGYYKIYHIIIPTLEWYKKAKAEQIDYFDFIYVSDGEVLYKVVDNLLEECTIKELIERNSERTTINKYKVNIFIDRHLVECYMNYCFEIFENGFDKCAKKSINTEARDFLWMSLNIIKYLTCRNQYLEAQRIIELLQRCGGYCDNYLNTKSEGCGCSKK